MMEKEDYKNIPTDYVVKRALGWLLVFVGWVGVILGVCIHFLGTEEGMYLGLQAMSIFVVFDTRKIEKPRYRRAAIAACLVIAVLTAFGAVRLHQYYLLWGAGLLLGLSILFSATRRKTVSDPVA
jgi:hypothetical protein